MNTAYVLHGGVLTLENLKVDNAFTEIQAEGDLNLVAQHASLIARAKLRGLASLPTALVGRLLTLDGEGTFSDIQWRLRYALGLEKLPVVGAEAAMGAAEAVGKATKGILGLPGRLLRKDEK